MIIHLSRETAEQLESALDNILHLIISDDDETEKRRTALRSVIEDIQSNHTETTRNTNIALDLHNEETARLESLVRD